MADDQKPKTMDISDLVKELSKSSTSSTTSAPSQPPRPSFPTTKPMSPPMAGSPMPGPSVQKPPTPVNPPHPVTPPPLKPLETPKPQFNVPNPPISKPSQTTVKPTTPLPPSSTTPSIKEYQSSIRTMSEDISKIKQGQQPAGVPVPRKVEQVIPAPPMTPPSAPQKPAPPHQFKVPNVNLGEAQKTGPLAPSKVPAAPVVPKSGGTAPKIFVPEAGQKGVNRNMLFIGIGVVAVIAGFAYWFFALRSPAPEVVTESPTPSVIYTATPTPTPISTLTSIFSGAPKQSLSIKPTNPLGLFVSDVGKVVIDPGAFKLIDVVDNTKTTPVTYNFSDIVTKLTLKIPSELISNFGNDSAIFVYGQKESFDSKGNLQVGVTAPNRIVMVAELKSPSGVYQITTSWESTLSSDLKTIFSLGTANKNQTGFLDNSYRGMSIRYRNFPYSDKTIDYAIVSALNGKTYLVITDSREAIFAVIDKLVSL